MRIQLIILVFIGSLISCKSAKESETENGKIKEVTTPLNSNLELSVKTDTIILEYFGFMCPCAQWIRSKDSEKFSIEGYEGFDSAYHDSIFMHINPSSDSVNYPEIRGEDLEILKYQFVGRFYKEKLFTGEEGEEFPEITFQFDEAKLVENTDLVLPDSLEIEFIPGIILTWDNINSIYIEDDNFISIKKKFEDHKDDLIDMISEEYTIHANVCSFDWRASKGLLAYTLIEQCRPIPWFKVFSIQFDAIDMDCRYPIGLLDYVSDNRDEVKQKLVGFL